MASNTNAINNVTFSVMLPMLRDSASFFKNPDVSGRQAGMTTLTNYVNLLNAFVLIPKTEIEIQNTGRTGVSPVLKGEIN